MDLAPFVSLGVLSLLSVVSAMAAWSTWNDKPGARVWGILAGLQLLLLPLVVMIFGHRPLTARGVPIILLGAFALIAYGWPDRQAEKVD